MGDDGRPCAVLFKAFIIGMPEELIPDEFGSIDASSNLKPVGI